MQKLYDSWHFVPHEDIPPIDSSVPFHKVYQLLYMGGYGGFLLGEGDRARIYVKAYELAETALRKVAGDPKKARELTETPIGQVVATLTEAEQKVIVPVPHDPVDIQSDENALRIPEERVFRVTDSGKTTGWYLNHESVRNTTTRRTIFVCEQGHDNSDPDQGRCYSCPFPIVKTREE